MKVRRPHRTLAQIVREECANWTSRGCVWGYACYVLNGHRCPYFEQAVLPAWPNIITEYKRTTAQDSNK